MGRIERTAANHHHVVHEPQKKTEQKSVEPIKIETRRGGNPTQNLSVKNSIDGNFLKSKLARQLDVNQARFAHPEDIKQIALSVKQKDFDVAVDIPVKQRHKGLSPYDGLPSFKNRSNDFPDRYRAVNPKSVSEGKTGKAAMFFPIKAGAKMYDGDGNPRSEITNKRIQLNYAQVKQIRGEKYYYAFAAKTTEGGASGWVKASSIKAGNDPKFSKTDVDGTRAKPVPTKYGEHADYKQYEVLNVDPQSLVGKDGKPVYKYEYKGKYYSYKVLPEKSLLNKQGDETRVAATDYLRRDGGVINLGGNAAGASNDTFKVDGNKPLVFHRAPAKAKGTTAEIDLFYGKEDDHAGKIPVKDKKMRFVYGYVEYERGKTDEGKPIIKKRWGWMALDALKPKS